MLKIILAIIALFSGEAFSADIKGRLSVTPIIGLERVQKFQPSPHMKSRAIFGARATYRFPISALEVEYTHAQDDSTDAATSTTYKDSEDKLRVGLRGSFTMSSFLTSYIRGGAQGRKNEQTRTVSGGSSTTSTSSKVQPYVGTGVELRVLEFFSLTADLLATYTPTDDPNLKDYELQPSLGINIRF